MRKCTIEGYELGFSDAGCCDEGTIFGLRKEDDYEIFLTRLRRDLGRDYQYEVVITMNNGEMTELQVLKTSGDGVSGEEMRYVMRVFDLALDHWPRQVAGFNVQAFREAAGRLVCT